LIEVAGVPVEFPADEGDTIAILRPFLELWLQKRAAAAADEAEAIAEGFRRPEILDQTKGQVRRLLGGDPLSPGADAVLAEGSEEIAAFAERWRHWSGRPSSIRLHNNATMAPHREGAKVAFGPLTYESTDGEMGIRLDVPLLTGRMGLDSIVTPNDELPGLSIDLPLFAPPGVAAERIADELGTILMEIQRMLRSFAGEEVGKNGAHYLVERLLVHEIGSRFLAEPASPVVSRALARIYLLAMINATKPPDGEGAGELLTRLFGIDAPELPDERAAFVERLAALDPLGEVPADFEGAAVRLLAYAIFKASESAPPFQLFRSEGIEMPPGGFGSAAFRSALARAYPGWASALEEARTQLLDRLSAKIDAAAEPNQPDYPDDYLSTTFDGLTFRHPPDLKAAVERIGPGWAADWHRARETMAGRFGGAWHEVERLSDEDFAALADYGVEPTREETEQYALMLTLAANLDKWLLRLISGSEVGVWYREDLEAILGQNGPFGGFRFDFAERSASFESPLLRPEHHRPPGSNGIEGAQLLAEAPELAFPVLLERGEIEGKPIEEQAAELERRDVFLRDLCRAAEKIEPEALAGAGKSALLSESQARFVMVHEAIEAALVRQVVGSPDRRWFCDGFANLVAIRECERRFGEGAGWTAFESLFDPESGRSLAGQVDLLAWPADGDENADLAKVGGLEAAHYHFATLALHRAAEGRGEGFLREWIEEIRKTPWNRANAATVIEAYGKISGEPLLPFLEKPGF
jgi:hypothetical protein